VPVQSQNVILAFVIFVKAGAHDTI
jgi:hypothetical protein